MDPHGQTNYSPPYHNIMSYWNGSCTRTEFTAGQYARADSYLNTDQSLLNTESPSSLVYGPLTISTGVEMKSAIFGITTSGTISLNGSVRASLQGQSVILSPGFYASPATGSILVSTTSCSYWYNISFNFELISDHRVSTTFAHCILPIDQVWFTKWYLHATVSLQHLASIMNILEW